ncbi:MAG TPA: hypothetical protein VF670_06795 [Duganella sp.]|jgi:hypothetical protein
MLDAAFACDATAGAVVAGGRLAAGLPAVAALLLRAAGSDAHPINGTAKKLAAVNPIPCCKNALRDAMANP